VCVRDEVRPVLIAVRFILKSTPTLADLLRFVLCVLIHFLGEMGAVIFLQPREGGIQWLLEVSI
jgi:hypothetical protein